MTDYTNSAEVQAAVRQTGQDVPEAHNQDASWGAQGTWHGDDAERDERGDPDYFDNE